MKSLYTGQHFDTGKHSPNVIGRVGATVVTWLICGWFASAATVMAQTSSMAEVYFLSGQSNMQGIGKLDQLPAPLTHPLDHVFFWNGSAFEKLDPNTTKISSRKGELGPELGFAKAISQLRPDQTIYLVKFAASGQPLHHGWDGNQWVGGSPSPMRKNFYPGLSADDPNIGVHFQAMMQRFKSATQALSQANIDFKVAGLVWMQGEQDAKHEISATSYAESLALLKQRWQEDLGPTEVPLVFGQVLAHSPTLARFTHRDPLRQSMVNADMNSKHVDAINNVWMQSTTGMPLLKDTVHYNAEGQFLLGQSFALLMIRAQNSISGNMGAALPQSDEIP